MVKILHRRPVAVEAVRYMGNPGEVAELAGAASYHENLFQGTFKVYLTNLSILEFNLGDWLLKYPGGRLEVARDNVIDRDFEADY